MEQNRKNNHKAQFIKKLVGIRYTMLFFINWKFEKEIHNSNNKRTVFSSDIGYFKNRVNYLTFFV